MRRLVFQHAAVVLEDNKDYLLQARLGPLLDREGLSTWEELVRRLSGTGSAALRQRVVEALVTHETSFFRDGRPFACLRDEVLPRLFAERARERTLHLWSAAASSGQEVYSLALLLKQMEAAWQGWTIRLVGSDLSREILDRARQARYSQLEVNRGMPPALLARYFEKQGNDWQLKDEVRRMVELHLINLIGPWPVLPAFDVVFLRNVLIYFDVPTKSRILDRVAQVMRPVGYLFLGGVESTMNLSDRFDEVLGAAAVCYRRRA